MQHGSCEGGTTNLVGIRASHQCVPLADSNCIWPLDRWVQEIEVGMDGWVPMEEQQVVPRCCRRLHCLPNTAVPFLRHSMLPTEQKYSNANPTPVALRCQVGAAAHRYSICRNKRHKRIQDTL